MNGKFPTILTPGKPRTKYNIHAKWWGNVLATELIVYDNFKPVQNIVNMGITDIIIIIIIIITLF